MARGVDKRSFLSEALQERRASQQFRSLNSIEPLSDKTHFRIGDKELINFSSNDYLGLSHHPEVVKRSAEYLKHYGASSGASRLVTGSLEIHHQLEHKLASTFGVEAALLLNTGFQANTTLLPSLTDRHSLILMDRLCHNSLLQGGLLSRGKFRRFEHNDMRHLRKLLEEAKLESFERIWIVSETVFSMDGDQSKLHELLELSEEFEALFYSDDAHAIGVLGEKGLGLNYGHQGIDISLGTFGKAFGGFGAFVGVSQEMKEYLINFCPGLIYSTALPPAVIGALDAAVDLIPAMDAEREQLFAKVRQLRQQLSDLGFELGDSDSQIIPVLIGDEAETLQLSEYLRERGIWASAIRPPTVAEGRSRIRLTITVDHTDEEIDQLTTCFQQWQKQ